MPCLDWRDALEVGDIIRSKAGTERVVRKVTKGAGRLYSIHLTILHCSWTHRAYTLLTRYDLGQRGFQPTGRRYHCDTALDHAIRREVNDYNLKVLDCCDVKGVR